MITKLHINENKRETIPSFDSYKSKEEIDSYQGNNKLDKKFDSFNTSLNRTLILIIGVAMFFFSLTNIFAQTNIARYSFSNSTGNTYTPITGGTVLTTGGYNNLVSSAITMGGTFNFGGTNFTKCYISSNGFINFGSAASTTNYTPISTLGSTTGAIVAFGQDGGGSTATGAAPEIRYQNTGTEFVVQFKDHANYNNRSTERLNFQIRLTYASGQIDIVYGACTAPGTSSTSGTSVQVGIRGNSVSYSSNVNNLYLKDVSTGTTCNWADAVAGFSNTSDILFSGTANASMNIPSGLKFTWVKQAAVAPVRTIAAPASVTASGATISWTAATGATKYDIQYRIVGDCSWTNWSGNPVTGTSVALTGLLPSTTYQVRIKSSNATVETYYSHITGTTANSDGYTTSGTFTTIASCTSPVATMSPASSVNVCSPTNSIQLGVNSTSNITAYQWLLNGTAIAGATAATYSATASGNYTVNLQSGACSSTISAVVSFNESPSLTANLSLSTICEGEALNFSANAIVSDSNYTVSSVNYSRLQASGTSTILAATGVNNSSTNFTGNLDDGYWSGVILPFNFNFYGANYSSLAISTNGNVQFGNSLSTTWVISPAPAAGVPNSYIGAPWVDLDFSSTTNGSKVEYFTNGTYPNRQFVINWYAPLYGSSDKDTCQLVLNEGSNSILVNLAAFINTTHQKTLGVENSNGTVATVAPGRNGNYWQATTNESWLFTRTNLSYVWSGPSSFSSTNQNPIIANALVSNSGNYTVTATDENGCTASSSVTASVGKAPVLTCPSNISVNATNGACNAIVSFAATALGSPAPTISYSVNSGSTFNVGTTTVTVIANNSCGADTCTFTVTVLAGSINYWVGGVNTDWFNASNWCAGMPTASTDVQISAGAVNMPVINSTGAVCKSITINANATLAMSSNSNLTVFGNWNMNGAFIATAGLVSFNGTSSQTISGAIAFNDFVLNNVNGIVLNNNVTINGLAQLVTGNITTGNSIVIVSNGGSLSSQAGHINGYLRKTINSGNAVMENFEVGNGINATPISLIFNNVTATGTLTVNSVNGDHSSIQASGFDLNKTINRNWNMVNAGIAFDYYDMNLEYLSTDADLNFLETYSSTKIYAAGAWNDVNTSYVGNNSVSIEQATIIGSVQVGMFNPVPEVYTVTPDFGYVGATSTVLIEGRGFINGVTSVNAMAGITINSTTINSDTTMTLSISVSATAALGSRSVIVTNVAPMGGSSNPVTFTVRSLPVANFYANSTTISCNTNTTVQFTNYSTDGATYSWNFGAGAVPATATGFGPHLVTYTSTGLKTVSMIAFSPIGNDTLVRTNFINVSASAPATPSSITGATNVCAYGTSNLTYTIPLVAGVTGYTWTIPAGVSVVSGLGTRSIVVNFSSTFSTGLLSVKQSNPCGTSAAKSITINRAPLMPTTITGPTMMCGLTTATYTATSVTGATSYVWTLPAGITSAAGASPVTTITNTISVAFASTFTTGLISVQAANACATSAAKSLTVSKAPATPGTITGAAMVCGLTTTTYSIAAVTGATGYSWTLPAGVTSVSGVSPISTTSASITVTFASSFTSGAISVKSTNACSSSAARSITISRAPATPGVITGPTAICTLTSASYSVVAVAGATSYLWTLPVGITTTTGASTLTTTLPTISVVVTTAFVSGNISVKASSACATSAARTLVLGSCLRSVTIEPTNDEEQIVSVFATLYPNPSSGEFNINYVSAISSDLHLEVYDAQGRKVFEKNEQIVEGENLLNYNSILENKGIYFVKFIDLQNNFVETKTLVVQ